MAGTNGNRGPTAYETKFAARLEASPGPDEVIQILSLFRQHA